MSLLPLSAISSSRGPSPRGPLLTAPKKVVAPEVTPDAAGSLFDAMIRVGDPGVVLAQVASWLEEHARIIAEATPEGEADQEVEAVYERTMLAVHYVTKARKFVTGGST